MNKKSTYRVYYTEYYKEFYSDYADVKSALDFMHYINGDKMIKITEEIIFEKDDLIY